MTLKWHCVAWVNFQQTFASMNPNINNDCPKEHIDLSGLLQYEIRSAQFTQNRPFQSS
jgi:hypothetical protein